MKRKISAALAAGSLVMAGQAWAQGYDMGKFEQTDGAAIWRNVCQGCHMPDARGAAGAAQYPALAGDPKLKSSLYPVFVLLHGQKGMPDLGTMMNDAQVAAITNYLRTNFGNHYKDAVTPDQVAALRAAK